MSILVNGQPVAGLRSGDILQAVTAKAFKVTLPDPSAVEEFARGIASEINNVAGRSGDQAAANVAAVLHKALSDETIALPERKKIGVPYMDDNAKNTAIDEFFAAVGVHLEESGMSADRIEKILPERLPVAFSLPSV